MTDGKLARQAGNKEIISYFMYSRYGYNTPSKDWLF